MNVAKIISIACLCVYITGMFNTASAAQKIKKVSTDQLLVQAYNRLIKKPAKKSTVKKAKHKTINAKKHNKKSQARFRVIATAKKQIRKKYRWGGSTPRSGFDCSGLTYYSFKSANIHLPRSAAAQYKHTKRVSMSKLQAGDLIFFHMHRTRARINHVGIYLGNGKFIHAPRRGKRVSVANLSQYWRKKAVGAGRV